MKSLKALFDFGPTPRAESNQVRTWINRSVPLFLSGLAVSVGFRMNLFNIGVEGQYSVAAVVAAAAGAMVTCPGRCTSPSSCWSPWRPARPTRRSRPSSR